MGAGWSMQCFGANGGASITVRANYWGVDYVDSVLAVFVADSPDVQLDPADSVELFSALAGLTAPSHQAEIESFIEAKAVGGDCPEGCSLVVSGVEVRVDTGSNGATQLTLAKPL
jgi:hypothetical protein